MAPPSFCHPVGGRSRKVRPALAAAVVDVGAAAVVADAVADAVDFEWFGGSSKLWLCSK